jgi:hypothetical protein
MIFARNFVEISPSNGPMAGGYTLNMTGHGFSQFALQMYV